ncbi:Small subunit (SSU) processome component [Entophlyctis sp. JEL0112]|nr:Small subunit (SSU) processome component [Entophlyctis sp. JEL0112]
MTSQHHANAAVADKAATVAKSVLNSRTSKYLRDGGQPQHSSKSILDIKARSQHKRLEAKYADAAKRAAQSELLLADAPGYIEAEGMERTYKFTQKLIVENVDANTQQKAFDLKLPEFGPYAVDYTRNGRHLLIGGRKGHVATFDWVQKILGTELHLNETVRDVQWLHNETMFAVAQKQYTYIYDKDGAEVHCLRKFVEVNRLEFLPYHFLLCGIGKNGFLKYQDTSTGKLVAEHRTRLGDCNTMTQNPYNAVINLGHSNGTVTMWSPSMNEPLVKILCHKGPVKGVAVDRGGYYMATSGLDGQLKIWDVRSYKCVHEYYTPTPASELSISQLGILAVGYGPNVTLWKDAFKTKQKSPYLTHLIPSQTVNSLAFCPFDDILAVGHTRGVASLIVPGSGEPNYDALEVNPYEQTTQQRRRAEVRGLLDKVQPEMIALNPDFVGTLDAGAAEEHAEEKRAEWEANHAGEKWEPRNRARGKSSAMKRVMRKQKNIVDPKRLEVLAKHRKDVEERERERKRKAGGADEEKRPYSALDRFAKKTKK